MSVWSREYEKKQQEKKLNELFKKPKEKKEAKALEIETPVSEKECIEKQKKNFQDSWEPVYFYRKSVPKNGMSRDFFAVKVGYRLIGGKFKMIITLHESILTKLKIISADIKASPFINLQDITIIKLKFSNEGLFKVKKYTKQDYKLQVPLGDKDYRNILKKDNYSMSYVAFEITEDGLIIFSTDILT